MIGHRRRPSATPRSNAPFSASSRPRHRRSRRRRAVTRRSDQSSNGASCPCARDDADSRPAQRSSNRAARRVVARTRRATPWSSTRLASAPCRCKLRTAAPQHVDSTRRNHQIGRSTAGLGTSVCLTVSSEVHIVCPSTRRSEQDQLLLLSCSGPVFPRDLLSTSVCLSTRCRTTSAAARPRAVDADDRVDRRRTAARLAGTSWTRSEPADDAIEPDDRDARCAVGPTDRNARGRRRDSADLCVLCDL